MRHCATSRKVAGSNPYVVIGISHWRNPSGRAMALGLTQPLTGMSKGIGKGGRCVGLTTFQHLCANYLENWEPQNPATLRACPGIDLHLSFILIIYFLIHILILSFRLPTNTFLYSKFPKGPWNINVNAWGFVILDYFLNDGHMELMMIDSWKRSRWLQRAALLFSRVYRAV